MRALKRRKAREEEGLFLAEGVRVVEELLDSPIVPRRAVVSGSLMEKMRGEALANALEAACPVERVSGRELASVAATETPQGVVVVAEIPRAELADIDLTGPGRRNALVLDAVQDPGNFGTLTRTAAAFEVDVVAALPGTVDPWNGKAVRSAAGASFHVPIVPCEPKALAVFLRGHGFTLYGADVRGEAVDAVAFEDRSALMVGNEGAGIGPEMREAVDTLTAVPIPGRAESLNVAVAAGILMYMMTRRH